MQSEKKGNPNASGTCSLRASAQELYRLPDFASLRSRRSEVNGRKKERARVFSCAHLFPSACYAVYDFARIFL